MLRDKRKHFLDFSTADEFVCCVALLSELGPLGLIKMSNGSVGVSATLDKVGCCGLLYVSKT